MSQLIQLRQRIQTTTTIRKTTNAMRLVAMSTHSRLRYQKNYLDSYKEVTDKLYSLISPSVPLSHPSSPSQGKELIIVIGSQKGLCGNFNTNMVAFFEQTRLHHSATASIITIGKQITDYLRQLGIEPRAQYNEFTAANFVAIAHEIATSMVHQSLYQTVTVLSTKPLSFFLQKQRETTLIPFKTPSANQSLPTDYLFEQQPTQIAHYVEQLQIKISLQILLFESLVAEQAARFLSMDAATRNADTMLVDMKRDYNKMRQAAITLELIDFASNTSAS